MDTKTVNKTQKMLIVILALVLVAGIAASCTLGALAIQRISGQAEQITQLGETLSAVVGSNSDTVTQEDDVAVAGEYYIRSTLPISDAYKSGDTSALDSKQLETLNMASKVLDEIITDGMTPYDKELAVYDWMCANLGHESGVTVVVPTASGALRRAQVRRGGLRGLCHDVQAFHADDGHRLHGRAQLLSQLEPRQAGRRVVSHRHLLRRQQR